MFEFKEEQKNHSLWVEKYRPNKLDDYVGNEHLKTKVAGYIETGDVPHLLLYGKAGTGKTTLAKLIVKSIDCDYMIINASDENGVDTLREKICFTILYHNQINLKSIVISSKILKF